ncbi:precursor of CEP9-like [Prosopis cineraria]|uniref:precursor of CEP9-like n=1 Tax=Prosopis cineraria TaxID=364024 RepID=UPI00240F9609|nr:precursor of CEP9-like [Prosopis cineraria]
MDEAILKYLAVVVVLVASREVVRTQGRQIKAWNQHSKTNKDTAIDGIIPTSSKKAVDESLHNVNSVPEDSSNGDHIISTYRPTTPGNSPGVGHRKFGEESRDTKTKEVVVESPDAKHYYSAMSKGSETYFKPTEPGHSPGVGHAAHQNKGNGEVEGVQNQLSN